MWQSGASKWPNGKFSDRKKIITPTYNGEQGNPVLFSKSIKEKLMDIKGDTGAKKILELNKEKILKIEIDNLLVSKDFNRREDFNS